MVRRRELSGYAHNLAQFMVGRWSGALATKLASLAQRRNMDVLRIELKSREVLPAEMDRLLTQRVMEHGLKSLVAMLDPVHRRANVLDSLNAVYVRFTFNDAGCEVSVELIDATGASHVGRSVYKDHSK